MSAVLRSAGRRLWASPHAAASVLRSPCPMRRGYAAVADPARFPSAGEQLHGFTLKRVKQFPEFELTAVQLEHDKTGAGYLHLARDDANNAFAIAFKTNPPDATGVPHILEHTTLCGSEKYPIRDPFFKMLPRSLSNYMNALTAADHTMYPFATTNTKDFQNLLSVYMDATLHPLLKENDFTQEGWRIGPENLLAPEGEDESAKRLVFKGVVYNEMKGQMSDPSYGFYVKFLEHLAPTLNNSGGDPQKMTDLTWEQLKKFHQDHYHPSNAKLISYGNMPLDEHLKEIDERLKHFDKITVDPDVKLPAELDGPKYVTVPGPFDPLVDPSRQHKTSVTWLMHDLKDTVENFAVVVLSTLLLDGYASPLYRSLIESGLGADFSPNTGRDSVGNRAVFSVGATSLREEDVPKVKEIITQTFRDVRQKGFDKIKVDGILHQLELTSRHKSASFGLTMVQRQFAPWFSGLDPMDSLAWQETVNAFRERYEKGGYLESLLDKYLMNDKTLNFTMKPSETHKQELADEENQRLADKILEATQKFPDEQETQKYLEDRELDLLEAQEKGRNEDLGCLPTVNVGDISRKLTRKPLVHSKVDDVPVQLREAPTNGLTYFRAFHQLQNLPDELREMVPLFSDAIMRLGTRSKSMEQLEELIRLKTGGISVGHHSSSSPFTVNAFTEGLCFSGCALDRNVPDMFELLRTVVMETDFDAPEAGRQIRELVMNQANNAMGLIADAGHTFAMKAAQANLTPVARVREQVEGLSQLKLITRLGSRPPSDSFDDVLQKLKDIQSFAITNSDRLRVFLTCSNESTATNQEALRRFLDALPKDSIVPRVSPTLQFPRHAKTLFPLPYQVHYSARAVPAVPYNYASGAPLEILAQLLTFKHLHHEIREKGGAYGGGATSNAPDGLFCMYSYRDPNPQNTMNIMSEAGQWARDSNWSARDLEEAKLGVFQGYEAPVSVSNEGMRLFLHGITDDMCQTRRERLLDVTTQDVRRVADEFIVQPSRSSTAILGEKTDWMNDANGWKTHEIGLSEQ